MDKNSKEYKDLCAMFDEAAKMLNTGKMKREEFCKHSADLVESVAEQFGRAKFQELVGASHKQGYDSIVFNIYQQLIVKEIEAIGNPLLDEEMSRIQKKALTQAQSIAKFYLSDYLMPDLLNKVDRSVAKHEDEKHKTARKKPVTRKPKMKKVH